MQPWAGGVGPSRRPFLAGCLGRRSAPPVGCCGSILEALRKGAWPPGCSGSRAAGAGAQLLLEPRRTPRELAVGSRLRERRASRERLVVSLEKMFQQLHTCQGCYAPGFWNPQ